MRKVLAVTAALATLGGTAAITVPAFAATGTGKVFNTQGQGLHIRSTPSLQGAKIGKLQTGQKVKITCQTIGDRVKGPYHSSNLWSYVDGRGYVSDAWLDTDAVTRIKGVPDCKQAPPKTTTKPTTKPTTQPTKPTTPVTGGDLVPVRQGQGQSSQWHDCGPTSMVISLKSVGVTPRGWSSSQRAAIVQARKDMGVPGDRSTTATQIIKGLSTYGVKGVRLRSADVMLDRAAAGGTVIVGGDAGVMPYRKNMVNQRAHTPHWLVVRGFDKKTQKFYVADPVSKTSEIHMVDRATLTRYINGAPIGGVSVTR